MWPLESVFLHALHPQRKTITFPIHTLHNGAVVVAEHEQPRAKRIELHLGLNDRHQTIDGFSHIDGLFVQVDRTALTLGS